jgi:hypothetical protein
MGYRSGGPRTAPRINAAQISEPHEVHTNVNDATVQEDGTVALVFTVSKEEWQRAILDSVVGVVDTAEVGAVHTLGERTEAETHQRHLVRSLAHCHLDGLWQTGVSRGS